MRFLNEDAIGPAIKSVMGGTGRRCAVAFWGRGAAASLFGDPGPRADDRLICDLSMGGSNPAELRTLAATARLRHQRGLHAKIYWSSAGLVVGSANASENGVGFSAPAGLIEAGVWIDPGEEAYAQAERWLKRQWKQASELDDEAWAAAEQAWARRSAAGRRGSGGAAADPDSLLDAVRADPERFRDVGFVLTERAWSEPDAKLNRAAAKADQPKRGPGQLSAADEAAIDGWSRHDMFGATADEEVNVRERFICIHRGRTLNTYWFYRRRFISRSREVILASPDPALKKEKGLKRPSRTMALADLQRTDALFAAWDGGGRRIFVDGEELARALDALNTA